MQDKYYSLTQSEGDVINLEFEGVKQLFSHPTHLVEDFSNKIKQAFNGISQDEREALIGEGLNCRMLELGNSSWQNGKVRLCLQFVPQQAEIEESIEAPVEELIEMPVQESIEAPVEELIEMPVAQSVGTPLEESIEVPVEESIEFSLNEELLESFIHEGSIEFHHEEIQPVLNGATLLDG